MEKGTYTFTDRYKSLDIHKCQGLRYWRAVNAIHTGSIHHRPAIKSVMVGNSGFLAQLAVIIANAQTSKPESLLKGSNYIFCQEVRQRGVIWRAPALSWDLKGPYRLKSYLQDAMGLVIHLAHMEHVYSFPIYCFYNISALKLNKTMFCKSSLVPISFL